MIVLVVFLGACRKEMYRAGCIADSVGPLEMLSSVPNCERELICRAKCMVGSRASCLGLAYEMEKKPENAGEAVTLYRRACVLGEANACTNYAASIWAKEHSDAQLKCAQRIFEKSCAAASLTFARTTTFSFTSRKSTV